MLSAILSAVITQNTLMRAQCKLIARALDVMFATHAAALDVSLGSQPVSSVTVTGPP